ncbi:MMPL family transporter [Thermosipho ferrireducens]|uniref:MMPL family transporter n=1 Tax=Thermosipho ferrireducens TaxID=2571116 RepID=A0ABX7S7C1_9BACT|nr:MMPL family transporter [Thermosipho ferrireducens]QTA37808.1 MMPL family transporter [Thermosipho ferrireducens]
MKNKNLFNFIIKNRILIIVISIFLTIFFGFVSLKTKIDMGTYNLLPGNDPEVQKFEQIAKNFGGFDNLIISVSGKNNQRMEMAVEEIVNIVKNLNKYVKDVDYKFPLTFIKSNFLLYLSEDTFDHITKIIEDNTELLALSKDRNVISKMLLYTVLKNKFDKEVIDFTYDYLINGKFAGNEIEKNLAMLNSEYYYNNMRNNILILLRPTNAEHNMIFFEKMVKTVENALKPVIQRYSDLSIGITGTAKVMQEQQENLNSKLSIISLMALVIIFFLFLIWFKKISAPFYIVIPVLLAIIWTLGINYLVIGRLNIVTSIFAVMLLGLGVDFSLHFLTKFYYEINAGKDVLESIRKVFEHTLPGISAGAITTAVSFYILMFSKFKGLYELGFIAGTGILMCLLAVMFLLPSILYYTKPKTEKIRSNTNFVKKYSNFLLNNKFLIMVIMFVVIFFPFFNGFEIKFNYNAFDLLPDIPSVRMQNKLKEEYDNSFEYNILRAFSIEEARKQYEALKNTDIYATIDSPVLLVPENQDKKLEVLKKLYKKYINAKPPKLANVPLKIEISILLNQLDNPALKQKYSPDTLSKIKSILVYLKGLNNKELEQLQEKLDTVLSMIIESMRNSVGKGKITLETLPDYVKKKYVGKDGSIATFVFVKRNMWDEASMKKIYRVLKNIDDDVSGTTFVWIKLLDYIRSDLLQSTMMVLLALVIIVVIHFKDLKLALLSLVPVVLGTLWLLGFMSLFDIRFNIANIVAIPLILGIGIDDGIHMLHSYISNRKNSIIPMLEQSGKAVIITSLTSMIGFGLLYFVKDPLVSQLGVLLFFGILFCLITSIVILPIFLKLFGKKVVEKVFDAKV